MPWYDLSTWGHPRSAAVYGGEGLVYFLDDGVGEVVGDDVCVAVALGCHDGGTDLAQSDTVAPDFAVETEGGFAIGLFLCDVEGRAVKVRGRQPFANLQFFAHDKRLFFACDAQSDYSA